MRKKNKSEIFVNVADEYANDFQTPIEVCHYMVRMLPLGVRTVLEPTPGVGNIVNALVRAGYSVTAPANFFTIQESRFDAIVMNPPFSGKYAFGVPDGLEKHGMRLGYHILTKCLHMSDNVIALMPWFTISDSDVRLRALKTWGLKSITALPRKTFDYARIQTVVLELQKGYIGMTEFKVFDLLSNNKQNLFH